jgi:hypothetical protein
MAQIEVIIDIETGKVTGKSLNEIHILPEHVRALAGIFGRESETKIRHGVHTHAKTEVKVNQG